MTAADLLKVLLELDQQCLTSRPSPWGKAALLLQRMCDHCSGELRNARGGIDPFPDDVLGDWRSVDLSSARKPAPFVALTRDTAGFFYHAEFRDVADWHSWLSRPQSDSAWSTLVRAETGQPVRQWRRTPGGPILEAIEAPREAGGKAWDKIDDPAEYPGRDEDD